MRLTLFIVLVNIAFFAYAFQNLEYFVNYYGFNVNSFAEGRYFNVVTAMFMHGSIMHVAGNMITLLFVGAVVERYAGWVRYLLVYFGSGLLVNLSILLFPVINIYVNVFGASGAISGLIGYGAFKLSGKWVSSPIKLIPIPMPFIVAGALYTVMNFYQLFVLNIVISSAGHLLGGCIGAMAGLAGEENKVRKIIIFLVLITFISVLPYAVKYLIQF